MAKVCSILRKPNGKVYGILSTANWKMYTLDMIHKLAKSYCFSYCIVSYACHSLCIKYWPCIYITQQNQQSQPSIKSSVKLFVIANVWKIVQFQPTIWTVGEWSCFYSLIHKECVLWCIFICVHMCRWICVLTSSCIKYLCIVVFVYVWVNMCILQQCLQFSYRLIPWALEPFRPHSALCSPNLAATFPRADWKSGNCFIRQFFCLFFVCLISHHPIIFVFQPHSALLAEPCCHLPRHLFSKMIFCKCW